MSKQIYEVIESYNNYLPRIPNGALSIADFLRSEEPKKAFSLLADLSEGISWVYDAGNLLSQNDVKVELNFKKIKDFLLEINEGLEKQDLLLVADILEYEIAPFFENVSLIMGEK